MPLTIITQVWGKKKQKFQTEPLLAFINYQQKHLIGEKKEKKKQLPFSPLPPKKVEKNNRASQELDECILVKDLLKETKIQANSRDDRRYSKTAIEFEKHRVRSKEIKERLYNRGIRVFHFQIL